MLTKISPKEAHRHFTEGTARFIDIRSPAEFAQMSIKGALLAPLSVVTLQNLKEECSPQKDVIFLCNSGNRTEDATNTLQSLFPSAYMLDGEL